MGARLVGGLNDVRVNVPDFVARPAAGQAGHGIDACLWAGGSMRGAGQ